jgi:hypothetical protein
MGEIIRRRSPAMSVAVCGLFALVACLALGTAAAQGKKTKTKTVFNNQVTPLPPGEDAAITSIKFPKRGKIRDINVIVRADVPSEGATLIFEPHKFASLFLTNVQSPAPAGPGFGRDIAEPPDCTGPNSVPTTFDDSAPLDIRAGTPPFAGSFQPLNLLSKYKGNPSKGEYSLLLNAQPHVGTLYCWGLQIKYKKKKK